MAGVTIKRIEQMESIWGGSFARARASLAAGSFAMNIWNSPPTWESWEHNHADPPVSDDEQEVYTALSGSATLPVGGEQHLLVPGVFARVGAAERRKLTTAGEGAQILCIGGMPGRVYEPLPIVELGGEGI
jgi:mannose-6-phosphate isomerase-like protein (cupin superfamily)